jgi:hypothetical protein
MLLGTALATLPPDDDGGDGEGDGGESGGSDHGCEVVVWTASNDAVCKSELFPGTLACKYDAKTDCAAKSSKSPSRQRRQSSTGGVAVPVRTLAFTPCCRGLMAFFFFAAFGYVAQQVSRTSEPSAPTCLVVVFHSHFTITC